MVRPHETAGEFIVLFQDLISVDTIFGLSGPVPVGLPRIGQNAFRQFPSPHMPGKNPQSSGGCYFICFGKALYNRAPARQTP